MSEDHSEIIDLGHESYTIRDAEAQDRGSNPTEASINFLKLGFQNVSEKVQKANQDMEWLMKFPSIAPMLLAPAGTISGAVIGAVSEGIGGLIKGYAIGLVAGVVLGTVGSLAGRYIETRRKAQTRM